MRRREFIGLIVGAAVMPLVATAQQTERMRRIGVLMNLAADDPESTVPPRTIPASTPAIRLVRRR